MNAITVGLFTGLLLGIAAAIDGLGAFLLTIVLGGAGALIAGHLSGELDLSAMVRTRERR